MFLPMRLVPLVQKYKGEQHTGEKILLTNTNLFWFFVPRIEEPMFVAGKDIPEKYLEHLTMYGTTQHLIGDGGGEVGANCLVIPDAFVIPGRWYEDRNGEHCTVLSIDNTNATYEESSEWPVGVTYRTGVLVWRCSIGRFVKNWKHKAPTEKIELPAPTPKVFSEEAQEVRRLLLTSPHLEGWANHTECFRIDAHYEATHDAPACIDIAISWYEGCVLPERYTVDVEIPKSINNDSITILGGHVMTGSPSGGTIRWTYHRKQ